jgi:serine/threonine protein kinase
LGISGRSQIIFGERAEPLQTHPYLVLKCRLRLNMSQPQTIGRYQIIAELGHGAMGSVYRAHDPTMDRTVAIKTILAAALTGPLAGEYRERFIREARAAGRLSHPGIVTVYDVSEQDGTPYLVMEFVAGRSLAAAMDAGERFSIDRIYELGQQVAEALGYAHRNGVVHRDVKPANILLAAPGPGEVERAKLADLGVAKLTATQITTTGQLLGTPAFMPPEQFTGVPIDGRADLFSLGVILYWLATGDKPFAGDTITAVSYKIVHSEPAPPRRINPAVPVALERIIMKCLEKDPATRYATGEVLAADLAAGHAGRDVSQMTPPVQRTTSGSILAPVAHMDGDPNTTLDTDARLQMAAVGMQPPATATQPLTANTGANVNASGVSERNVNASGGMDAGATVNATAGANAPSGVIAKPAAKKGTLGTLAIAIIAGVVIVGSISTISIVRHRKQVREQLEAQQAQDAALAADRAKADELAKQVAAQGDASLTPPDPNAPQTAQGAQQAGSSMTAAPNTTTAPGAKNSDASSDKKNSAKTPATKGPNKSSTPVTPVAGSSSAQAQQAISPPQVQNPAPVPVVSTPPPAAAATTNPSTPANSGASAPPAAAKPADAVAPADFAKLRIDDRTVPNSISFTVMMDGKLFFQRAALAEGQQDPKHDDDSIPPGTHQFQVITSSGGLQVTESNSVRFDFQSKKKLTLKIEVRDGASGQMLKRSSKLDAGTSSFQISVKPTGILGF